MQPKRITIVIDLPIDTFNPIPFAHSRRGFAIILWYLLHDGLYTRNFNCVEKFICKMYNVKVITTINNRHNNHENTISYCWNIVTEFSDKIFRK